MVAGRYECVSFAIEFVDKLAPQAPPRDRVITAQLMRSIPVGRIIDQVREKRAGELRAILRTASKKAGVDYRASEQLLAERLAKAPREDGRPRMYGNDHYETVAAVYSAAWQAGLAPTKAVEKQFLVSHATAARWVQECRRRGFLGPTEKRKAGGVLPGEGE